MDETTLLNINFEEEIEILREPEVEPTKTWGKDLKVMPMFSVQDIEIHREKSGKLPGVSIIKTLDRGKKYNQF